MSNILLTLKTLLVSTEKDNDIIEEAFAGIIKGSDCVTNPTFLSSTKMSR